MKADFSGFATKAGLRCSDGRTIMPGAFKHQDQMRVPLVWQHGHNDPENVLGHAILEDRGDEGVYAYGFFNDTNKAEHSRTLLEHGDINMMSIYANQLIEKAGRVIHGAIREVSLVLSGANPGALIENVTIRHSDGDFTELEDEVVIYTGEELHHGEELSEEIEEVEEASEDEVTHDDLDDVDPKNQEIYDSMTEDQKELLHSMLEDALEGKLEHAEDEDMTIEEVYNGMTDTQKKVLHYMIGEAIEAAKGGEAKQDNMSDEDADEDTINEQEGSEMTHHNVFEGNGTSGAPEVVLSHDDIQGIVADATKNGSLKGAVEQYALQHNITDVDQLFPDAQFVGGTPEWDKRRTEWVAQFLGGVTKTPFSRIRTMSADITLDEARAKGYVKGAMKKEEFFSVQKRETTPTTIYKKQKLDRDDMVDITDFDVVMWLKGEMRLMLDEEIARAMLIGDGRDVADEDKVDETKVRPIASDHELYTTTAYVNIDDANSSVQEVIDAIIENRRYWKGSGSPTMYTTETYLAKFMTLKDTVGRRIYKSLEELAAELRVAQIVPVEVMEDVDDLVAVIVNPQDYRLGADKGGQVSMFDDFDIDYNQHKYLIETRMSGALSKIKSALVVRKVASTDVLVVPAEPAFNPANGEITITDQTGVLYQDASNDSAMTAAGSPYTVSSGATFVVNAVPDTGYYFPNTAGDSWTFVADNY